VSLQPEDRIVYVAAVLPKIADTKPRTLDALRAVAHGHPVESRNDLRGYTAGWDWVSLDLGVLRGDEKLVVRERLSPAEVVFVAAPRWDQGGTLRRNGIDLSPVVDWPADTVPTHAQPGDHVVLYVTRGSAAGLAGLRPLDAVLDANSLLRTGRSVVRTVDGVEKDMVIPATVRSRDIWIPFVYAHIRDVAHPYVGFGPLDLLSHYWHRSYYEPAADAYRRDKQFTLLSVFRSETLDQVSGTRWALQVGYFPQPSAALKQVNLSSDGGYLLGAWSVPPRTIVVERPVDRVRVVETEVDKVVEKRVEVPVVVEKIVEREVRVEVSVERVVEREIQVEVPVEVVVRECPLLRVTRSDGLQWWQVDARRWIHLGTGALQPGSIIRGSSATSYLVAEERRFRLGRNAFVVTSNLTGKPIPVLSSSGGASRKRPPGAAGAVSRDARMDDLLTAWSTGSRADRYRAQKELIRRWQEFGPVRPNSFFAVFDLDAIGREPRVEERAPPRTADEWSNWWRQVQPTRRKK
jgi:hypothetical protein